MTSIPDRFAGTPDPSVGPWTGLLAVARALRDAGLTEEHMVAAARWAWCQTEPDPRQAVAPGPPTSR